MIVRTVNTTNIPGVNKSGFIVKDQKYMNAKTIFAKMKNHNSGCLTNSARILEAVFFIVFKLYPNLHDFLLYECTVYGKTILFCETSDGKSFDFR